MKVCIDDLLTVDCEGFLNGGEKWNGWEQPIFNANQLTTIRQWWECENPSATVEEWEQEVVRLGYGQFFLSGWVWKMHPDFALCDDCGDSIFWSDPQAKWLHEDTDTDCFLSSNSNPTREEVAR